jgi:hypothetical protein
MHPFSSKSKGNMKIASSAIITLLSVFFTIPSELAGVAYKKTELLKGAWVSGYLMTLSLNQGGKGGHS